MIYTNLAAIKTAVEGIGSTYYKTVCIGWAQKAERQKLPICYIVPEDGSVAGFQVTVVNIRIICIFFDNIGTLYSTMDSAMEAMCDAMRTSCAFMSKTFSFRYNPAIPEVLGWGDFIEPLGAFELNYVMSSHVRS